MRKLVNVICSDDYTDAATLSNVIESSGGYFNITGADCFVEVQYGLHGQTNFTDEVHIPVGGGILVKGTSGIRFKNFVAGQIATVSAALSEKSEPPIQIAATGQSSSTSGAGMQLIQRIGPLALAQSSFDFTAIPQTFRDLELRIQGRTTAVITSTSLAFRLNGDVGANYDFQSSIQRGVPNNANGAAQTSLLVQGLNGASDTALAAASFICAINNYVGTTLRKQIVVSGWGKDAVDATPASFESIIGGGEWRNIVAITQITAFPLAGNFDVGSIGSLYGIP